MSAEPTKTELPDLGRQIFYLSQLVELTSGILEDCNGHVTGQPVENLDRVHEDLVRLSKEISRLQEERGNLLALADVGNIVNSSLDLNDVLCIVMDNIVRLTGAERGFLMLKDEAGEMATTVARNWEQESIDPTELSVSRTVINRVVTERVPVLTTNAQEDPRFGHQASVVFHNLRSILCVPLILRDEITGVIYADHRVRTGIFTETHRNLLVAFANQAAVAIENARLFESVRRTLAEVTELKNLLDNVFASLVSGVITADEQNKISLCNRAAQSILGQSESDLIGKTLGEILPDIGTNLNQFIDTVRRTDRPITGKEVFPVLPRRGKVTLNLHISPLKVAADTSQGVAIVLDDLTEKKRLEGQYRLFERMISPAVICQLDPDKLQLGGKRTAITTMFADIRDFTGFSESLAPETLVSVLNRYLAAAADAVLAQDGTIDKFLGDALMAWFNAPIPQADHTLRAVQAAVGIRSAVQNLRTELPPEFHLSFSVGIHFGEAVLGLVGTEKRLEYTAIGDSVNTTKRIQEQAAGGQILISETAYPFVADHVTVRAVKPLILKGKRQPVTVYEVLKLK